MITVICSGNRLNLEGDMMSEFRIKDPVFGYQTLTVIGKYEIGRSYILRIDEAQTVEEGIL